MPADNPFGTPNLQLDLLWSFWWSFSQNMFTGVGNMGPPLWHYI